MADLTELVNKFKDKAGGMYEIAISSSRMADGAVIGAPYAIDVWPAQWRIDAIGGATGGRFFESYDEMLSLGPKIQQPPKTYLYAMAMGHEGDHMNNMVTLLWAYGGRLADEKGVPDRTNPANKAGIDMALQLWKAKLIPPDTFAQTVTSWNNETYQKSRGLIAINPCTIMGWLLVNDKELGEKIRLVAAAQGHAAHSPKARRSPSTITEGAPGEHGSVGGSSSQPDKLEAISKSVEGRFVPAYRDHAKTEFWTTSKFAELKKIAEYGRIREYPAAPVPWLSDVTDAKYILSDMMQKIINDNMRIEDAQAWAQQQMMDSYNKNKKA
jgi:ABC-type glycerol-3-phosphate transport system substrate-binding protein